MSKESPTAGEIQAIMILVKYGWIKLEVTSPSSQAREKQS